MRAPTPHRQLFWHCAGDIVGFDEPGLGKWLTRERAEQLRLFYLGEVLKHTGPARDFCIKASRDLFRAIREADAYPGSPAAGREAA